MGRGDEEVGGGVVMPENKLSSRDFGEGHSWILLIGDECPSL